jgi:hypothetical protein
VSASSARVTVRGRASGRRRGRAAAVLIKGGLDL